MATISSAGLGDYFQQQYAQLNNIYSQHTDNALMNTNPFYTTTATDNLTLGGASFPFVTYGNGMTVATPDNSKTLETIKGAIHTIRDEAVSEEVQGEVKTKIDKFKKAGFARQAALLETELRARGRLARIQEWDYKVLPYNAIKAYDRKMIHGWTMVVHIDPVDKYIGVPEGAVVEGEFDKIVPEHVIDSLLTAQERQVFDDYHVLWVEKVKDPLLLGKVKELPDYFLIDEWGDDIKFSDIIKATKNKKK